MSGSNICARGKHNASAFIMSCVRKAFSEHTLHRRWLPAEQLRSYMHMKYEIGEEIKFSLSAMMRVINKALPMASSLPNIVEIPGGGGSQLQVFIHSFQNRTRRYFFWVTAQNGMIPSFPSQKKAMAWEEDCVLTRLLSGGRERPLVLSMTSNEDEEPMPKRQKGLLTVVADEDRTNRPTSNFLPRQPSSVALSSSLPSIMATSTTTSTSSSTNNNCWWESGDAKRLFAPASSSWLMIQRIVVSSKMSCK